MRKRRLPVTPFGFPEAQYAGDTAGLDWWTRDDLRHLRKLRNAGADLSEMEQRHGAEKFAQMLALVVERDRPKSAFIPTYRIYPDS